MEPHQRQHAGQLGACRSARMVLATGALLEAFHCPACDTPPVPAPTPFFPSSPQPGEIFQWKLWVTHPILYRWQPGNSCRKSSRAPLTPGHPQSRGPSHPPTSTAPRLLTGQRICSQAQLQGLLLPGVLFILTSTQAHLGRACRQGQAAQVS